MMTSAQVVEMPFNAVIDSPSQDYAYQDDPTSPAYGSVTVLLVRLCCVCMSAI